MPTHFGLLDDRIALVTGATSGIGEVTARALAAAGATVVVSGRRSAEGARVVGDIVAAGGRADFVPADLRERGAADRLVERTVEQFGRLDIAFNNAGIFDRMHSFETYGDEAWDATIETNLSAVFRCMRAELRAMSAAGRGVIVNNASTVSHRGTMRSGPAYVAAKHGVLGLTRQAAVEFAARGIRVNAVSPGPTLTPVAAPLVAEGPEVVRQALESLNPTGAFVPIEDVAATVVFLCSDAASMINGHDVALDGGQLAKL
jgi:NAD(P)-dependent dehydrogenase (short-subunit alcohol dehydrogenase family)